VMRGLKVVILPMAPVRAGVPAHLSGEVSSQYCRLQM
jgi:hypothetical protein